MHNTALCHLCKGYQPLAASRNHLSGPADVQLLCL
ncbi:hypothetical protein Nmel_010260 [Mimus melanotis]